MAIPRDLVEKLDFSIGDDFAQKVRRRFGAQVHHESPSSRGSFFMLATFRRFLFHLSEESVALVLESCLGGHAPFFHVVEVSHNHFRFSVSSKAVGFFVYALRRVIGSSFDVYFHLWSNGFPHWENEKRIWEMEEAKKWQEVRSKSQIRAAKAKQVCPNSVKKVRFNPILVQGSSNHDHRDYEQSIQFGSFRSSVLTHDRMASSSIVFPNQFGFDNVGQASSLKSSVHSSLDRHDFQSLVIKSALKTTTPLDSVNLGAGFLVRNQEGWQNRGSKTSSVVQPNQCSKCLRVGHVKAKCNFQVRCLECYNYGHWARSCLSWPKCRLKWRPKIAVPSENILGPKLQWKPKIPLPLRTREGHSTQLICEAVHPPWETQVSPSPTPRSPIHIPELAGTGEALPIISETDTPIEVDPAAFFPRCPVPMANFACDPAPFIPFGAHLEDGWHRPARSRVAIGGEPPRRHEEFAVISLVPPPPPEHARVTLEDVVHLLQQDFPVRVQSFHLSPLGLGLIEFGSAIQRQSMLDISPIAINNSLLHVYKHDEAINLRACHYSREC
jgi:hypothetical protein